jgi:streptogramin lyase
MPRHRRLALQILIGVLAVALASGPVALAFHGDPHQGSFKTWPISTAGFGATLPQEAVDDVVGLTNQVGAPAVVTAATMPRQAGETGAATRPGLVYWNPATNQFKRMSVPMAGFQFAVDINRSTPSAGPPTLGGGDAWGTVFEASVSLYVNLRGTNEIIAWNMTNPEVPAAQREPTADRASGVRVNPTNGKVYFGDLGTATRQGRLFELDPTTNTVRRWTIGNRPYNLVLDPLGDVWATAVAGHGHPDQILRLNPTTGALTRWSVPGAGNFAPGVGPTLGTPNFITLDAEANVWFTETGSDEVGRLNPVLNVFTEYTKPGVTNPAGMATTGVGPTTQVFFNEAITGAGAGRTSVLTPLFGSPLITPVTPIPDTPPTRTFPVVTHSATRVPVTATITPTDTPSTSTNGSGIDRFPIPATSNDPTGMSRVAFPETVFGSMSRSHEVFQFMSGAVLQIEEEGKVTGGGYYAVPGGAATFGFNVQRKDASDPIKGQLQYHNHATGENVHSVTIDTLLILDTDSDGKNDTAIFSGTCTINKVPCTFEVRVEDRGEPGVNDTFQISGTVITPTAGTLGGGNIKIHKSK